MLRRLASLAVLSSVFFVALPGWSQQVPTPARLSFTVGAGYDQGNFGTDELSRALYFPFSFRYAKPRFDFSVSSSIARLNAPDGVRLIDGVSTRVGPDGVPIRDTGMGDVILRSRLFLVEDRGPGTSAPSIAPYFRLKIPTASVESGMGTGETDYGFGVEVDKTFDSVFVFGDLGYTVVGQIRRMALRNRALGSIGIGKQLSDDLSVSGMLDWRRSIVDGNPNPTDLVAILSYRLGDTTISPNALVGLTDGSPDFVLGIQLRFRLGQ